MPDTDALVLDLTAAAPDLLQALIDVPSESLQEAVLADAVEAAVSALSLIHI